MIKGPFRSRDINSIVEEAKKLVEMGTKEIVLIAQDLTLYGIDLYGKPALEELLVRLDKLRGDFWIRLLYLHPSGIRKRLIETISELEKVVRYLEVPIQHISDRILRSMKRAGGERKVRWAIDTIRSTIPDAFIRTEIIVGFPGESDSDFEDLLAYLEDMSFERIGVFPYCDEPETHAYKLENKLDPNIVSERYETALHIANLLMEKAQKRLLGKKLKALSDAKERNTTLLRTEYDAPEIDFTVRVMRKLEVGKFYTIKPTDFRDGELIALTPSSDQELERADVY